MTKVASVGEIAQNSLRPVPLVSFLGPMGTFSEATVERVFGDLEFSGLPKATIDDCMGSLTSGTADYAVLPIENSTGGIVPDFWNNLSTSSEDRNWYIAGDTITEVSQHLFVTRKTLEQGKSPTKIFSHWQALRQCRKYLDHTLPEAEQVPVNSTAEAGRLVAEHPNETYAAIGHKNIGDNFGLVGLDRTIEDNRFNQTRFFILGRNDSRSERPVFPGGNSPWRVLTYHSSADSSLQSIPQYLSLIEESYGWLLSGFYPLPKPGYLGQYNVFMDWITKGSSPRPAMQSRTLDTLSPHILEKYRRFE